MSAPVAPHRAAPRAVPLAAPFVGFTEGTLITCKVNNKEETVAVQNLKPGMMVKTGDGLFRPVDKIGSRSLTNPTGSARVAERLYTLKKTDHPSLTADLTVTGNRSVLAHTVTDADRRQMIAVHGRITVADKKFCVPCVADAKAQPAAVTGAVTIYNFSLVCPGRVTSYGVYANGLLVDSANIAQMMNPAYTLLH